MNTLEKLIQQYCPNRVEYKTLGEICENVTSGGTPQSTRHDYYGGDIPWLRTQEVNWDYILDTEIKITQAGYDNSSVKWIPTNCVIVAMYGATAGKVAINKIPLTTNQACCNLEINKEIALTRFIFYVLCNKYNELKSLGQGSQSNINSQIIKNFSVPVPPLPVQEEIVRILDAFTELESALEAELEARRKQYEYYRNELLSFDKLGGGGKAGGVQFLRNLCNKYCPNGVEYKTLGEICEVSRGKVISKDYIQKNPGIYPVYSSQTVNDGNLGDISTYDYCGEFLTWTTDGANAGSVFYRNGRFNITNVCGLLKVNIPNFHIRFLYHWLSIKTSSYVVSGMGNPKLMSNVMSQIIVPVPPLPVQEEIVRILDRFDALVNDISIGLPAELSARRQQYEYYRNRLLSFERAR